MTDVILEQLAGYFKEIIEAIMLREWEVYLREKVRSYFRTTNWLERCFKELKDNIRVRGYSRS